MQGLGTDNTQPAEFLNADDDKLYDPAAYDVHSCGVILFWLVGYECLWLSCMDGYTNPDGLSHCGYSGWLAMVKGCYRDGDANVFLGIAGDDVDDVNGGPKNSRFWEYFEHGGLRVTEPCKVLVNKMCNRDDLNRISMEDVMASPFLAEPDHPDPGVFIAEMQSRDHIRATGSKQLLLEAANKEAAIDAIGMIGPAVLGPDAQLKVKIKGANLATVYVQVGEIRFYTIRVRMVAENKFMLKCNWEEGKWVLWMEFVHAVERIAILPD